MKRYPLNPEYQRLSESEQQTDQPAGPAGEGFIALDSVDVKPSADDLLALAKWITGARYRRKSFLAAQLFGEPAWDMLLALFSADATGHRISVSGMCHASEAPATTALRWIDTLEELGMVVRRKNPLDARVIFIELAPEAREQIRDYLLETWASLYPG